MPAPAMNMNPEDLFNLFKAHLQSFLSYDAKKSEEGRNAIYELTKDHRTDGQFNIAYAMAFVCNDGAGLCSEGEKLSNLERFAAAVYIIDNNLISRYAKNGRPSNLFHHESEIMKGAKAIMAGRVVIQDPSLKKAFEMMQDDYEDDFKHKSKSSFRR